MNTNDRETTSHLNQTSNRFYQMDTRQYPFVSILFIHNPPSIEDFRLFLCDCKKLYGINASLKMVLSIRNRGFTMISPNILLEIVRFMKENEENTKAHIEEVGIFVQSPIFRTMVNGVRRLKEPSVPWKTFSNENEYSQWIESLEDRQILFPS